MDRIHRMGQTQKVNTYRYIVKDSIDEVIVCPIGRNLLGCS
jgi:SNF2 family DNA or RNA helicase